MENSEYARFLETGCLLFRSSLRHCEQVTVRRLATVRFERLGHARSMKESRDRENAEANLEALQQEQARLEAQFQSEVSNVEAKSNPVTETLENVLITPTKTNIKVRLVALAWKTC